MRRLDWHSDEDLWAAVRANGGPFDLVLGSSLQFETWIVRDAPRAPRRPYASCRSATLTLTLTLELKFIRYPHPHPHPYILPLPLPLPTFSLTLAQERAPAVLAALTHSGRGRRSLLAFAHASAALRPELWTSAHTAAPTRDSAETTAAGVAPDAAEDAAGRAAPRAADDAARGALTPPGLRLEELGRFSGVELGLPTRWSASTSDFEVVLLQRTA